MSRGKLCDPALKVVPEVVRPFLNCVRLFSNCLVMFEYLKLKK